MSTCIDAGLTDSWARGAMTGETKDSNFEHIDVHVNVQTQMNFLNADTDVYVNLAMLNVDAHAGC